MPENKSIEEQAGESLAEIWDQLDRKARAENPEEYRRAEKIFTKWTQRLAQILDANK
jgi:hypothetical protein